MESSFDNAPTNPELSKDELNKLLGEVDTLATKILVKHRLHNDPDVAAVSAITAELAKQDKYGLLEIHATQGGYRIDHMSGGGDSDKPESLTRFVLERDRANPDEYSLSVYDPQPNQEVTGGQLTAPHPSNSAEAVQLKELLKLAHTGDEEMDIDALERDFQKYFDNPDAHL